MSVAFYVNGLARLVMACAIADEYFSGQDRHLVLLHQYGYRYDSILPKIRDRFASVTDFSLSQRKYSHSSQFANAYFQDHPALRRAFGPGMDAVLFDISSPVQKWIVAHNKRLGNRVTVFAESLAVDRCFASPEPHEWGRRLGRFLFPRAFGYQHDYDRFYVHLPALYASHPQAEKLAPIAELYRSNSFARYATLLTSHLPLDEYREYDTVFFGQALSNYHTILSHAQEEAMLREIVGDRPVLVLPHPNERLGPAHKYHILKNARVAQGGVPSDLRVNLLRPKKTLTFGSTTGITYAIVAPESINRFFPIKSSQLGILDKHARHLDNIRIDRRYVMPLQSNPSR